jgi:hypothetical protein
MAETKQTEKEKKNSSVDETSNDSSEKVSELEEELSEETEFHIEETLLTEGVTPTLEELQRVESTSEASSLEEQVAEERPLETSDRRTGVDYGSAFSNTDYLSAAGGRERTRTGGEYVVEHFDTPRTHVQNARDFMIHDSRLDSKDNFHRQVEVDLMKYDRKRLPFEEDDKKYAA